MDALRALAPNWGVLSRLLDEALELPMAERERWLERLPAAQAGLKPALAQMLRSAPLLASDDVLGTLPKWPAGHPSAAAREGPDAGDDAQAGDRVGSYRLLSRIGHGAMGEVWRAERADGQLQRTVALKLPRAAWGGALAERLRRECDILATLEHPNIARLYDAGSDHLGRPYLAMEYVEGEAIDRYCEAQGLTVRARLRLLLQVAAAVAHAHARLVVHRDLKPSNILVTPQGQVRLLDFGIAKLMEGDRAHETALTRLAGRPLTPDYASPEQILGEPLGTGSDVYSLGVVAYELLSGVRPYRLKRGTTAELEEAITDAEIPRLSDAANSPALRRELRGELDAILGQALRRAQAERYPTMEAFAQDMDRYLAGRPVRAVPDRRLYRLRKFVFLHRLPISAAAAVMMTALGGAALASWQAVLAHQEARRAEQEIARQEAVRHYYIESLATLAQWDAQTFAQQGSVTRLLRRKFEELQPQYASRPEELRAIVSAVAVQLNLSGDFEGAWVLGRQHLDELKVAGAPTRAVLAAFATLGRTLEQLGCLEESAAIRREAMAWNTADTSSIVQQYRMVLTSDLGSLLDRMGHRVEARQLLLDAEAMAATSFKAERDRFSNLHRLAARQIGFDDRQALVDAEGAHAAIVASGVAESNDLILSLASLGAARLANGQTAAAADALAEVHRRSAELYGATDRDTVRFLALLTQALARSGRHEEARQMLSQTADALRAAPGLPIQPQLLAMVTGSQLENEWLFGDTAAAARHVQTLDPRSVADPLLRGADRVLLLEAEHLLFIGHALEAQRRLTEAEQALSPALNAMPVGFRLAAAQVWTKLALGDAPGALDRADALLASMTSAGAARSWLYVVALEMAALAAARTSSPERAEALLKVAGERRTQLAPPGPVDHADSLMRRSQTMAAMSRPQEALALGGQALAALPHQHQFSPRLVEARALVASISRH